MKTTEFFLAQLEREAAGNRRALARVPEGRPEWKPHEKSMPMGYLSGLVAMMPGWIAMALDQDELDINPPGAAAYRPPAPSTQRELLAIHEDSVAKASEALRRTTEEHLTTPWRLLDGGTVVLDQPRQVVIADTFCHMAHHRGQLTVYLRMNDASVPAIYGPSADETSWE